MAIILLLVALLLRPYVMQIRAPNFGLNLCLPGKDCKDQEAWPSSAGNAEAESSVLGIADHQALSRQASVHRGKSLWSKHSFDLLAYSKVHPSDHVLSLKIPKAEIWLTIGKDFEAHACWRLHVCTCCSVSNA